MAFELNQDELVIVKQLVKEQLSELNQEIQHTGKSAMRDDLRERRVKLEELYQRIQAVSPGDD